MEIRRMLLSGVVVRSIVTTARTRTEYFSVIYDPEVTGNNSAKREDIPGSMLGEQPFSGMSDEAFVIWDAPLPAHAWADPIEWFAGNELRDPPPPVVRDATQLRTLSEDEFWPVIDTLEGRLWGRTIEVAAGRLAQQPEDFILRWAQTAAVKAVALADVLERAGVDVASELHAIGAVLGQGRQSFDTVLANVDAFDLDWGTDNSPQVIWLAEHALARTAGFSVFITTAFTRRHREILARQNEEVAEYQRARGIHPQPLEPSFRAARRVVNTLDAPRERIALVPAYTAAGQSLEEAARVDLTADGSTLIAGPEFANQQGIGLWGAEAFIIKRRTSFDVAEYIARYTTTQSPQLPADNGHAHH